MKKLLEISLGIVTSVGGFLEIGSIATAASRVSAGRATRVEDVALPGATGVRGIAWIDGRRVTFPKAVERNRGVGVFAAEALSDAISFSNRAISSFNRFARSSNGSGLRANKGIRCWSMPAPNHD